MKSGKENEAEVVGTIRVAMADSLCTPLIAEGFASFREKHPGVSLNVTTAGTDQLYRLIDRNEVDVVCTLDSLIYDTTYVIASQERIGAHFVASPKNPICRKNVVSIEELCTLPFLLTEKGMSYRRLLDEKLAEHMLEVSPVFAANKPQIQVHPLGIGGKEAPARLVFDGISGEGVAVSMIDMGNRFRLICAKINLVEQPKPMPKLPVARLMWRPVPDFKTGAAAWIYAGGAHHAVVSTALTVDDIRLFAKLTDTELVVIDEKTNLFDLEERLYGGK
jgi:DNA-binding transcriptional LysR family regulator